MTLQPAGTVLDYRVTYLEMRDRPSWGWPQLPANRPASLLKAEKPPVWYFLSLYDAVGRDYAWEDRHDDPPEQLAAWLDSPEVTLWTLMRNGWPHGFFVLDQTQPGVCELAYFGLVPEAIGQGFGTFLLRTAVLTAWDMPGVATVTVHTCSLDHPRALASYQRAGFVAVGQEFRSRTLRRPRDLSRIPD